MNSSHEGFFRSGAWLVSLPVLLTVYIPRTPILGGHFFVYGVLTAVLGLLLIVGLTHNSGVDRGVVGAWSWLAALALTTVLSQIVNTPDLLYTGLLRLLRPLLFGIIVTYGFKVGRQVGLINVRRGLLCAAYAILLGEAVVGGAQALSIDIFNIIYSPDKISSFEEVFRITGTMTNPNWLGWIVLQSMVMIQIFSRGKKRYVWITLGSLIILATGSRTMLLLLPAVFLLTEWLAGQGLGRKISTLLPALLLVAMVGYVVISMGNYFPYISQLEMILTGSSITDISSIQARILHWSRVGEAFAEGGIDAWLLGLSDRPISQTLDNDYLYVLFRNGIIGFAVHISFLVYLLWTFASSRSKLGSLGCVYLLSAMVMGVVADTMAGWFPPIWLMLFLGLQIGIDQYDGRHLTRLNKTNRAHLAPTRN